MTEKMTYQPFADGCFPPKETPPMTIPEDLEVWDEAVVREVVATYWSAESGLYDFKAALSPTAQDSDLAASIRRTAASMANTGGGVLLFGIRELPTNPQRREQEHRKGIDGLMVGIARGPDWRSQVGDKLGQIDPPLTFTPRNQPIPLTATSDRPDGQIVIAVRIPESPLRPHMVRTSGTFYRRGDGGQAVAMSYYEVRDQMVYGARQQSRLRMLQLELREVEAQAQRLRAARIRGSDQLSPSPWTAIERFDVQALKALLVETLNVLPAGLANAIYDLTAAAGRLNRLLDRSEQTFGATHMEYDHLVAGVQTTAQNIQERLREALGEIA
jgi:hypothetical protein